MKASTLVLLFLTGCHTPPAATHAIGISVPWPSDQPFTVAKKLHKAATSDTPEGLSDPDSPSDYANPIKVIRGAAEEKDRARDYVLAPHSSPEAIDELTRLSLGLDAARKHMEETRVRTGKYDREDVISLWRVRNAMRDFINQVNGH